MSFFITALTFCDVVIPRTFSATSRHDTGVPFLRMNSSVAGMRTVRVSFASGDSDDGRFLVAILCICSNFSISSWSVQPRLFNASIARAIAWAFVRVLVLLAIMTTFLIERGETTFGFFLAPFDTDIIHPIDLDHSENRPSTHLIHIFRTRLP